MGDKEIRPLIYTIGDSHALHAWCKIPGVVAESIGPMLMYTFGGHPYPIPEKIPMGSIVVFCWGEIDCRCHVYKFPPWKETVDKLALDYISGIRAVSKDHTPWIYNVVPPARKDKFMESQGFPFLGTDQERLGYVLRLNKRLKESGLEFVDTYDECSDADGFLRYEMSDCHVHVEDPKPITDWLNRRF